ncbi:MAG: hypothetical protein HY553_16070 [Elusimicrobia bacterium]|nr:hypothetical protein [Elusimicrobiota bacterium]
MPSKTPMVLVLAATLSFLSLPAVAQDAVNESTPETRNPLLEAVRHTGYRVSCSARRVLGLCGASRQGVRSMYRAEPAREHHQYNAFQRLAGMIADRLEAGAVGNVKLKFKIILE